MPRKTRVEKADVAVAETAAAVRHHPVTKLAGALSEIADQPQMITLCSTMLSVGLLRHDEKLARTGGRMLAAELVATAMKSAVKHRIVRTRPHVIDDGDDYRMEKGNDRSGPMSSFPSGHTAGAVAVALAASHDYAQIRFASLTAAAAVAAIQIPRCKHFVSDIAAGAAVGVLAAGFVRLAEGGVVKLLNRALSGNLAGRHPPAGGPTPSLPAPR